MNDVYKKNFKDVSFNQNKSEVMAEMDGIDNVLQDKQVKIKLMNKKRLNK